MIIEPQILRSRSTKTKSPTTVVVDLGGSWLRLAAAKGSTRALYKWKKNGVSLEQLVPVLHSLWKRNEWNNVQRLIVGSKGIWTLSERKKLARKLSSLAKTVNTLSDIELAIHTALGHPRKGTVGIFLVAGTGSIAMGITQTGRWIRVGGLGPKRGDEGSGWWMGNEFLKRNALPLTGLSIKETAALAKTVFRRSARDSRCAQIIHEAQNHLASLVVKLSQKMKGISPLPVSWGGSLMAKSQFRKGVFFAVRQQTPRTSFTFVPPGEPPEQRAARSPSLIPQRPPPAVPPRFLAKKKSRPFSHNPTA
ncbi:MAG: hypothetical protein JNK54_02120 [Elusimicrobia bacterium]|nr:hypothetical protein [Elusimicrobiota bacterium]